MLGQHERPTTPPRRQPAGQHITSDLGHQDGPPVATDAPRASTCPLRTRSAGQRRELAVTPGQPGTPAHPHLGRLTRCANRPVSNGSGGKSRGA
jgi:hypothetical protein